MTHNINIASALVPKSISISDGDAVVWINNTATVQTASSNDAGQTFTTGPIQPNANSLPIAVPSATSYTVSPAGFTGNIVFTANIT